MTENLNIALQLLIVGMLSVFFILAIVVGLGRLLIFTVNKYSPVVLEKPATRLVSTENQEIAVLTSVVEIVTLGKGKIKSIKKI